MYEKMSTPGVASSWTAWVMKTGILFQAPFDPIDIRK